MLDRYLKICSIQIVVLDFIGLNAIFYLVRSWLRQNGLAIHIDVDTFLLGANIAWMVALYTTGIYFASQQLSYERVARKTLQSIFLFLLFLLAYLFLNRLLYSRIFVILYCSLFVMVVLINRFLFYLVTNYILRSKAIQKKVVILGYNEVSKRLVDSFLDVKSNLQFEGFFEEYSKVHELSYYPVIGNLEDCVPYAKSNNIREIYSTLSPEQFPYLYTLAHEAEKHFIRFRFVPDFRMFVNRQIYIDYFNNIPIISLRSEPLDDIANRIRKRIFDIAVSGLVTIFILSWLIPLLALLIRLESKGPIFFIQHRTGRNNQTFRCLKLRSMKVNKDANEKQASRNDNRFTRIGRILRKTNLDEMPQFLNVLLGDMSIVGPRPHMLRHTEEYSRIIQQYMVRHFLKPGITGWAQVNGFRGEITEEHQLKKRIEHDIWYMENWSVYLDLRIMFMTVMNTVRGDKNAF
ncbi:putative colanic acid biosysnthesis UDP-glucose lipid carrier transferase [Chitinophaga rupis]|uniref:Putative colanic acid biosysnthesis UDP-glucose lipid carrier transferase n=1 Tax=Chitinophaga rupis TaxID=573321 RepID=A0A1H7VDB0_9BACT|nr:undecaprenyl-phosphate glucose phosphotransferase [Chitinophaga rupis]SEM07060.1 putative colanic acid biosysnthesis UDP-glucose lipid carrier transferase [Chitinophaga rupis]